MKAFKRNITGSNVCVVGGAGFLGSHLVNHLINTRGCNVLVIDNLVSGKKAFVNPKAGFEHHDITLSEHHIFKLFKTYAIDYVFNYAAQPYIPVSFERPLHVFNTNAVGALHVINAAQEANCKGILQVSSAEIYGECKDQSSIDESSKVCPHSSYGAAKAAIDSMVQVRYKEAGTKCIALRQFNCVGERETHPYIIPELMSQFAHTYSLTGKIQLGNNSFRDFMYAGDAVAYAVVLMENGEFGEVYNLGSESGLMIYDLAVMVGGIFGYKSAYIKESIVVDPARVRPWEIWRLCSDNTKINNVVNYRAKTTLYEAILMTVEWWTKQNCVWPWERQK